MASAWDSMNPLSLSSTLDTLFLPDFQFSDNCCRANNQITLRSKVLTRGPSGRVSARISAAPPPGDCREPPGVCRGVLKALESCFLVVAPPRAGPPVVLSGLYHTMLAFTLSAVFRVVLWDGG